MSQLYLSVLIHLNPQGLQLHLSPRLRLLPLSRQSLLQVRPQLAAALGRELGPGRKGAEKDLLGHLSDPSGPRRVKFLEKDNKLNSREGKTCLDMFR